MAVRRIRAKPRPPGQGAADAEGFSLAEVLVAGLVILAVVVASARLVSTSLAGGQQTAQRQRVEAEIASDLDLVNQQDLILQSRINELKSSSSANPEACANPAASLKTSVDAAMPAQGGSSGLWSRQTSTTANGLLQVTYSLRLPGSSGGETRVVEITPAIQGPCLERSLGLS